MARKKKVSKSQIEKYLLQIINDYNDKNEEGQPLDQRVKANDYLKAVSMLATMNGLDKPATNNKNDEELDFIV